jgi:hypothetical protein
MVAVAGGRRALALSNRVEELMGVVELIVR